MVVIVNQLLEYTRLDSHGNALTELKHANHEGTMRVFSHVMKERLTELLQVVHRRPGPVLAPFQNKDVLACGLRSPSGGPSGGGTTMMNLGQFLEGAELKNGLPCV